MRRENGCAWKTFTRTLNLPIDGPKEPVSERYGYRPPKEIGVPRRIAGSVPIQIAQSSRGFP